MKEPKLSNKVINRIKNFDEKYLKLNKNQKLLIDELIFNKDLNFRYKRYGLCKDCFQPRTGHSWCHQCNSKNFLRNFKNWTSENQNVDDFIRRAQLKARKYFEVLEWVEFDRFEGVEYLARGGFGTVYKAIWKDGYIKNWDSENNQWVRYRHKNYPVALKCLDNSQDITIEFLKEVESHLIMNTVSYVVCCFGITKDPGTNNFMMIMKYAECGGLRQHLNDNFSSMDWDMKLRMLHTIAIGLHNIHDNKLIHHDFHSGNIVILSKDVAMITDLGLCQPANIKSGENKPIYGVLPYLAPEVIRRKEYTQASDIYGFGIIAYEICTGFPPYYDVPHEEFLAIGVCQGLRPKCKYKVPEIILDIIQKCWDEDPLKRPKAEKLDKLFRDLVRLENSKVNIQFIEADEFNEMLSCSTSPSSTGKLSYVTHSQAIYTSRLLEFKNIPEIKVVECDKDDDLESVRIGISKLRINKELLTPPQNV